MTIDKNCSKNLMYLSTLNFVLIFFGYQFIASIGLPFMNADTGSRFITVPYRAFTLGLSIYLFFKSGNQLPSTSIANCIWAYWILLVIRLVYDFYLQSSFMISEAGKSKVLLFMFCITLPQVLAFAKTWDKVDYPKALFYSVISLVLIAVVNLIFNKALLSDAFVTNTSGRVDGGIALNTISFGHCGTSLALLSVFFLNYRKDVKKWMGIGLLLLGLFVMIRAGSRGPVFSFLIVSSLIFSFKSRQFIYVILMMGLIVLCLYVFQNELLDLVKNVSPVLSNRLMSTIQTGEMTGRDKSFAKALEIWYDNPILGKYFTFYFGSPANPGYTHNIILDAAIVGGIIGIGLILALYFSVLKSLYYSCSYNKKILWIPILATQNFVAALSSGSFYYNPVLTVSAIAISLLGLNTMCTITGIFELEQDDDLESDT